MVKRIKLSFVPGLEVEFVNRVRGIERVLEWGEKSTWHPIVVFGSEGCSKTAWLKQAKEFTAGTDIDEIVSKLFEKLLQIQLATYLLG
jgi:hypothetical protein